MTRSRRVVLSWLSLGVLALAFLTPRPAHAVPTSFEWGTFSAAGETTYGIYDSDNATILETGDLVQLIWAGGDGAIDPPLPDGSPGGDDQLLDTSSVQNTGALPPPLQNKGYMPLTTSTFDTQDPWAGGVVYLRAWNGAQPLTASAYGDSGTGLLEESGVLNALRFYTDQTQEINSIWLPIILR